MYVRLLLTYVIETSLIFTWLFPAFTHSNTNNTHKYIYNLIEIYQFINFYLTLSCLYTLKHKQHTQIYIYNLIEIYQFINFYLTLSCLDTLKHKQNTQIYIYL
jgi:hypothetical protein